MANFFSETLPNLIQSIAKAFEGFYWPALIFPVLTLAFAVLFFVWYGKSMQPKAGTLEWIERIRPSVFSLEGKPGRITGVDWAVMLSVTLVYACMALFVLLGDNKAPQSFWKATTEEPSVTIDLGETREITRMVYYTGLGHGEWTLEFSQDGYSWRIQPSMTQKYSSTFKWQYASLEEPSAPLTRYVRVTARDMPMELGEIILVARENGVDTLLKSKSFASSDAGTARLFDEQNLSPAYPSQLNGAIFDEIYHAYTAYQYIEGVYPYETTHPPLGKFIIFLGIRIFGMTPFGWRFMGTLFGVLMVPLIYIFIKNIFRKTPIAACGTALFAFESMHFTQTRLATIDTYGVFFTLLMYFFMYRFITSGYEAPLKKTVLPLFLCGLSFGLGIASKWTGFYAAVGLVALYVIYLAARGRHQIANGQKREYLSFLITTLGCSLLFFVLVPGVIYLLSYIPYATAGGQPLNLERLWSVMWDNQVSMFNYHSGVTATHSYQSRWYQWIVDARPILYYRRVAGDARTMIMAFTTPLTTVGGLAAVGACALGFLRGKNRDALFIFIGYLAQLVPWMLVSRITFAYHYFPSMIFLTLALCYVFNNIWEMRPQHRWRIYLFTGVAMLQFIMLSPMMAGITVPEWYFNYFCRWLPSWPI